MADAASTPPPVRDRYSTVAIVLHWLIAAAILFQISLGWRMEDLHGPAKFGLFQLHKSVGITILLLTVLRIAWRLSHRPPPDAPGMAVWERALSKTVHFGFYLVLLGTPLTGWLMVSTSKTAIPTLLYGVVPWPMLPGLAQLSGAARHAAHEAGETGHSIFIWLAIVLFVLHVAGALKHQFIGGDAPVISRMAPGVRRGAGLAVGLLAILALVVGAIAAGKLVQAPPPAALATGPAPAASPVAPAVAPAVAPPDANAAQPAPAAPSAEPVTWVVEPGSTLSFATNWSGTAINGRFTRWSADILFSPEALDRSHVTVSIDLTSVDTGDGQRDSSLKGEEWFDTASHKTATFKATRFTHAAGDNYVAHGTLTLRGAAKPVSLPFRLQITGDKARVRGVTSLDRTAFGVGQGEWTSTDEIPAKVSLTVDLKAHRK